MKLPQAQASKTETVTARVKGKCNTLMKRSGIRGCFCRGEPETAEDRERGTRDHPEAVDGGGK